jgi:hypothetical protein
MEIDSWIFGNIQGEDAAQSLGVPMRKRNPRLKTSSRLSFQSIICQGITHKLSSVAAVSPLSTRRKGAI